MRSKAQVSGMVLLVGFWLVVRLVQREIVAGRGSKHWYIGNEGRLEGG